MKNIPEYEKVVGLNNRNNTGLWFKLEKLHV